MKDTRRITVLIMVLICMAFFTPHSYSQQITKKNDREKLAELIKEYQIDASNIKISYDQKGNLNILEIVDVNSLHDIDLSDFKKLKELRLNKTRIENIDSSKLPLSLSLLNLRDNPLLNRINLDNFINLKKITLSNCDLRNLRLTNLPLLTTLDVFSNEHLVEIDLSDSPNIKNLNLPFPEHTAMLKKIILHDNNKFVEGANLILFSRDKTGSLTNKRHFYKKGKHKFLIYSRSYTSQPTHHRPNSHKNSKQQIKTKELQTFLLTLLTIVGIPYPFLFIVTFFLYPRSEKIRKLLYRTGFGKLFVKPFSLLNICFRRVRYDMFSYCLETLTEGAKLDQNEMNDNNEQCYTTDRTLKQEKSLDNINGTILLKGLKNYDNSLYLKRLVNKYKMNSRKTKIIPIYLKASNCDTDIIKVIHKMLKKDKTIFREKDIETMIEMKSFAVFIDGYNNLENLENGSDLKKNIQDFVKDYGQHQVLISLVKTDESQFPSGIVYYLSRTMPNLN